MLPVIFRLGPFTLYSFGLFMLVGFLGGLFLIWKKTRDEHYDETDVLDVVLAVGFWALVGARLFYIATHINHFGVAFLDWLNIFGKPGFSFLGGLMGGVLRLATECRRRKWDFYEFADFMTIGITFAMVFGWLGSFLNGSNFGLPTESVFGLRFVGMFDRRHPVQLYATLLYSLLFAYLFWVEGRFRTFDWYRAGKSGAKSGFLVFNFVLCLGLVQLLLSWFSPPSVVVAQLALDAYLWSILIVVGLVGLYARSGRELSRDFSVLSLSKRRERIEKRREKRMGGTQT